MSTVADDVDFDDPDWTFPTLELAGDPVRIRSNLDIGDRRISARLAR